MTPASLTAQVAGPQTCRVRVVGVPHRLGIVAAEPLEQGALLFPVDGMTTTRPSQYSIQIDDRLHIDLGPDAPLEEMRVRYPWRFLNHSCRPNAAYRDRVFLTLRPVEAGEFVTYNYNTTELDMAVPFDCRCGSIGCLGHVSGFAHLPLAEQARLQPWLADHLRRRLDAALQLARA